MSSDEALLILRDSPALDLEESARAVAAIVEILASASTVVAQEMVLLVVSRA